MIGCRALSDSEIELILNNLLTQRDKTLFLFNLYTGFRIQESLSIKVSDVFNGTTMLKMVTVNRHNMKGKDKSRTIILHPKASKCIYKLIIDSGLSQSDFLFKGRKGTNAISRVQAWRVLKDAVNKSKLEGKIALHSTRKVFADRMYTKFNKDLIKTSKALGHKSIMNTVSYLSFRTEELDEAILDMKEYD